MLINNQGGTLTMLPHFMHSTNELHDFYMTFPFSDRVHDKHNFFLATVKWY